MFPLQESQGKHSQTLVFSKKLSSGVFFGPIIRILADDHERFEADLELVCSNELEPTQPHVPTSEIESGYVCTIFLCRYDSMRMCHCLTFFEVIVVYHY